MVSKSLMMKTEANNNIEQAYDVLKKEHDQALRALEESQIKLADYQDLAKIGSYVYHIPTKSVKCSKELKQLLKYNIEKELNWPNFIQKIHHTKDVVKVSDWINDLLESPEKPSTTIEYRLIKKDGQIIFVHSRAKINYIKGKANSVHILCQEIHPFELEDSKNIINRFHSFFSNAEYGIAICKIIRDKAEKAIDFEHIQVNEATGTQTGYMPNQLIGKRVSELLDRKSVV